MPPDFDFGIVQDTAHRPWPMPAGPWVMTQSWHDLLFAHWAVPASLITAQLPKGLELDLFDGRAWLGVVPFWMSNVSPRSVPPLPWVSSFSELNVRTYVTVGGRPGVYFFSLDADNPLAVASARALFSLPYYWASMRTRVEPGAGAGGVGVVHYESDRPASREPRARFIARYWPVGPCFNAQPGTLDYFLTERYCLYTAHGGQPTTVDIHHRPWPLQRADADIQVNTMAAAAGVPHGSETPVLHFVKRLDVVAWPPRALARPT